MAKARILVVDDAEDTRNLLRLELSNAGYEVETAEDAIVAGRRVLESPPHLLITDVHMPFMTGLELVAAMRADGGVPDIPVIFLTASDDVDSQRGPLRAAAWLRKPVNGERLLQVVALQVPA
jgi:two-component system nitrogen regulation response regulator GlnG